jgi:hypothetical protein
MKILHGHNVSASKAAEIEAQACQNMVNLG